jgi:hypothetical protein
VAGFFALMLTLGWEPHGDYKKKIEKDLPALQHNPEKESPSAGTH